LWEKRQWGITFDPIGMLLSASCRETSCQRIVVEKKKAEAKAKAKEREKEKRTSCQQDSCKQT
jgi:hypothetical protein